MTDNNNKNLSDEELKDVNAGMKIITDNDGSKETSWWETIVDFFFKQK